MAAIQTLYRGIEYRSRLEARWAAFFDQLGWEHVYEPFDADGYIPDFLIQGDEPMLIEVKPAVTLTDFMQHQFRLYNSLKNHWERIVITVGLSPTNRFEGPIARSTVLQEVEYINEIESEARTDLILNLPFLGVSLDMFLEKSVEHPEHDLRNTMNRAVLLRDSTRAKVYVSNLPHIQWMSSFPPYGLSGSSSGLEPIPQADIDMKWAAATNDVKWRGTSPITYP